MGTAINMRRAEVVIDSQVKITERVIEVDLHRDRESRVVILALNHWLVLHDLLLHLLIVRCLAAVAG
jgi:hypothetical protein